MMRDERMKRGAKASDRCKCREVRVEDIRIEIYLRGGVRRNAADETKVQRAAQDVAQERKHRDRIAVYRGRREQGSQVLNREGWVRECWRQRIHKDNFSQGTTRLGEGADDDVNEADKPAIAIQNDAGMEEAYERKASTKVMLTDCGISFLLNVSTFRSSLAF
jgi:hypothetical protein